MAKPSQLDQVQLALRLAREHPERAVALAEEVRAHGGAAAAIESKALWALGLAAREMSHITEAIGWLRLAVKAAEPSADVDLVAEIRVSLASSLAFAGDSRSALDTLDAARPGERVASIVASDRAGILSMMGRYEEALSGYGPAVEDFRRRGDSVREGRALTNRGLLYVYTGRFALAESDLSRAEQLFVTLGLQTEAAIAAHNSGFAAARRGDLPVALALFERAHRAYTEAGVPPGALALDRAEAMLAAGLVNDARALLGVAIGELETHGNRSALAEGLVLLADVALLAGDAPGSATAAEDAAALFLEQDRPTWAAIAQAARARAVLAAAAPITTPIRPARRGPAANQTPGDANEIARLAGVAAMELERAGLRAEAVGAHACAGELWLLAGAPDHAEAELSAASAGRRLGTARARAVAWDAEAVRRLTAGDRRGAFSALRAGMRVISTHQDSLGATELRANVAVHAERTSARGLRLALEDGRPRQIFTWMERRKASRRRKSLRPPIGQPVMGWLEELRMLSHDIEEGGTSSTDVRPLLRRQARLERAVRERAWNVDGDDERTPGEKGGERLTLVTTMKALGDRALVEMAAIDGILHAIVLAGGHSYHRRLGPLAAIDAELEHVRMSLRSKAYDVATRSGRDDSADRLDALLVDPLIPLIGSRPLVIVPTGPLHATPWAALPTLAGRPLAVAPSAGAWLHASQVPARPEAPLLSAPPAQSAAPSLTFPTARSVGSSLSAPPEPSGVPVLGASRDRRSEVLVVAGPGLEWAGAEGDALRSLYPGASLLSGPAARATALLAGLERCDIAHIATHATFRADNGLWSSLILDDGPLSVYEMEGLRRAPALVVLSACQSGLSTVRPGDELLGLVAGLLSLGTATVVASVVPVGDAATTPLMVDLHRRLSAGAAPAVALAEAQASSADPVAAASFVCFGAG